MADIRGPPWPGGCGRSRRSLRRSMKGPRPGPGTIRQRGWRQGV